MCRCPAAAWLMQRRSMIVSKISIWPLYIHKLCLCLLYLYSMSTTKYRYIDRSMHIHMYPLRHFFLSQYRERPLSFSVLRASFSLSIDRKREIRRITNSGGRSGAFLYVHVHICRYDSHIYVYVCVCICIYTHAHTHTCTHTRTHNIYRE